MAHALRERSPREILHTAEDWARRQPLAFFGAATLAGFALARFARSSAQHAHGPAHAPYGGTADSRRDMRTAGTTTTGAVAGGSLPGTPDAGMSVSGNDETGTPRPATLASATLGGAAAYRPRGGTENG
jgi:hypothetical protein